MTKKAYLVFRRGVSTVLPLWGRLSVDGRSVNQPQSHNLLDRRMFSWNSQRDANHQLETSF